MTRGQTQAHLDEFVRRDVVVATSDHRYTARIPFFGMWLREWGPSKIGAQLGGGEVAEELRKREDALRITATELAELTERWGTYRGVPVTGEDVRAWLDQFVGLEPQRLMFRILEGLTFYNGALINEKLAEAHAGVVRGTRERPGALSRSDVVVSYLDGAGKSGPDMAKRYRMVNDIAYDNVLELAELEQVLESAPPAGVIFVDDFVATGQSIGAGVARLPSGVLEYLRDSRIRTGFACVAGFEQGLKRITAAFKHVGIRARVRAGDLLSERDQCFHEQSRFFSSARERLSAEAVARRIGEELDRRQPAGYGDMQAAVVFESSCPNNSLPILWASSANRWRPLFPRR
jgi:hypothetical protein